VKDKHGKGKSIEHSDCHHVQLLKVIPSGNLT